MKKLLLSALAVCAFTFSNAQETETTESNGVAKGDMMISGAFGIDSESTGDNKENSFTIAPRFSYFVSDNIAVGAKIGFTSTKMEQAGVTDEVKTNALSLGAFGRYYMSPASKFSVFAELGADFTSYKWEQGSADSDSAGFGLGVAPGVSYFLSDSFAIEASWGLLGYNTNDNGGNGADSTDKFELGLDMRDLTFGLAYKF